MRIGLAGSQTPKETLERILPTIRQDMVLESDRIRDANFENHVRMREIDTAEERAAAIAEFLSIEEDAALALAKTEHLFAD
jgi:predicted metallo-beta-lactamase superfamily hydrolase